MMMLRSVTMSTVTTLSGFVDPAISGLIGDKRETLGLNR